ncbi:MAG: leucine-rich repeat protein [Bacteroidaceae bacterium]|nr:leucine-rich repeat protein [Bacteroidaceae bacterium]
MGTRINARNFFGRVAMLLTMLTVAFTAWAQTASTEDGWVIQKSSDGTRCILKDFNGYNGNRNNVTVYPAIIDGAAVVNISLGVEPKDFPNLETVYMYDGFEYFEMPSVYRTGGNVTPPLKHIHVVNSSGTVVAEDAIPNGITKIPDDCFYKCMQMEKLTLPDGLKVIGSYAFYCCNALKDIIIPDGVTDIGEHAFDGCETLSSIAIPNSVTTIAIKTFYACKKLESVTIPNSVTSIGESAFYNCIALKNITIPSSVTAIADYTFYGCEKLENVIIPNSVTSIGNYAFKDCKTLTSITIPTSVTSIGYYAFSGCSSLKDLYFDAPKAQWDAVTKEILWNDDVHSNFKEHWRCTVTFKTNNASYSIPAITNMWSNWTLGNPAATLPIAGWYTDADFTNEWHFDSDLVPGDMTLYAKWADPCAVTASTDAPSIDIPYGQEWTNIPVTLNSLTLGWFQNAGRAVREADAVAVTPFVGSGANADFTFYDGSTTLTATKGAGAHTDGNQLSEPLTAAGQSATLWVHIPQSTWESAAAGNYTGQLSYDALFISNADPVETYTYSLGSEAQVTINLRIPEAATLTFLPNGGSGTMDDINARVGITTTLPACTFTAPEGKAFLCWNTKTDGTGTRYYAGSPFVPTGSMTLYAEWGTDYVIDLTTTEVGASVSIPLGLYAQLTQLKGYFNNEIAPMGLDLNLDGEKDLALVQKRDEETDQMTASVQVLTSLTENYRFVLTTSGEEGEVGSVIFRFASEGQTVEQAVIEELYDDNGTYNREQLLVLKDGQPHDLMLTGRTLYRDGDWNTLCLPFAVGSFSGTPLDGATVMELDTEGTHDGHQTGLEDGTLYLYFTSATAIEAGKPYIVKWQTTGADIVNPVFRGVTVTTSTQEIENPFRDSYEDPATITVAAPTDVTNRDGKVTFKGNYDKIAFDTDNSNILFMGAENTLYWPQSGASIGAFRAYFEIADGASIKAFNLNLGDGTETGIDLSPAQGEGAPAVYDLNGRRLSGKPTQRGIYIVNGRKVVVK